LFRHDVKLSILHFHIALPVDRSKLRALTKKNSKSYLLEFQDFAILGRFSFNTVFNLVVL